MVADVFRDRGRHVDAARMNGQSGVCQGGMETSFKGDVTVFSIEISPIIRFNSSSQLRRYAFLLLFSFDIFFAFNKKEKKFGK